MKLLILKIYPAPFNFLRLRSKYSPQRPLLKRPASSAMTVGDQTKIRILRPQNTSFERRRSQKKTCCLPELLEVLP
jgi:hypothetical protein